MTESQSPSFCMQLSTGFKLLAEKNGKVLPKLNAATRNKKPLIKRVSENKDLIKK